MAQITIGETAYDAYTDIPSADIYLAVDVALHSAWGGLDGDTKGRAIISATRLLQSLCWEAGAPPPFDDIPDAVVEAVIVLSAMTAAEPGLVSGTAGAVNGQTGGQDVRRAEAGSAAVEFFDPLRKPRARQETTFGTAGSLPSRVKALLDGAKLLCTSGAVRFRPHNAGQNAERCPDSCESGFSGPLS